MQGGSGKISLDELNKRINELLEQSIKSDGVINLFSDVKQEFSIFDNYPPEGMESALQTVMAQCELWADNPMSNI